MLNVLSIPLITAFFCYLIGKEKIIGYVSLAGSITLSIMSLPLINKSILSPVMAMNGILYMDSLSAYIMGLIIFLGLLSAAYSVGYIEHEFRIGLTDLKGVKRYYVLFHIFIFTMLLVIVANNLAIMWVAIEATTIVSAVLIGLGFTKRPLAIEAAWKYIILCTVGITFALLGIFITYYASISVIKTEGALNWTVLKDISHQLNPSTMKLAFIFILVGYGTKAGLAPIHNWLPDAHSEAPSPISALLSGILLNTAFYGIMRFVSIVSSSTGTTFTSNLLIIFGLISIGISAIFILVQENYKRLLAYSSIEHMGIISLGTGIGSFYGFYGALLHILNHALAKPLMFFASGMIQAYYGSTRIEKVKGVLNSMPLLGTLTFIGALSLSGTPPLNIFISEFIILKACVEKGLWFVTGLFLLFSIIVFYGILNAFGRILFKKGKDEVRSYSSIKAENGISNTLSTSIMIIMAVLIIITGINIPDFIDTTIRACVNIMGVR